MVQVEILEQPDLSAQMLEDIIYQVLRLEQEQMAPEDKVVLVVVVADAKMVLL
jgi:hypothetical protein